MKKIVNLKGVDLLTKKALFFQNPIIKTFRQIERSWLLYLPFLVHMERLNMIFQDIGFHSFAAIHTVDHLDFNFLLFLDLILFCWSSNWDWSCCVCVSSTWKLRFLRRDANYGRTQQLTLGCASTYETFRHFLLSHSAANFTFEYSDWFSPQAMNHFGL